MSDVSVDWLPETKEEEQPKRMYGVVTGRVINLLDPMMLGRVQVQMECVDDLDLQPWARIAQPMAGIISGTYFIPNPGDQVLIAFEHGDINAPYIIGSLWTGFAPPPLPSPIPQIREIRTPVGNQIIFMDIPPTIQLLTPTGQVLTMSPDGINLLSPVSVKILVGDNLVTISPAGVTITAAKALNITAGASISITAVGSISLKAAGTCEIKAPTIRLN
ncbi:MAG: phage baseplate assembly protein V [Bryobacteraceae bacterium]